MVTINGKSFDASELEALAKAGVLQIGQKNDPLSMTINSQPPYGPYQDGSGRSGVFSVPGIRPELFSAFQRPFSLARILGVRLSDIANEKIGIMTGITDAEGTNPSDFCGQPPVAGQFKLCKQNYIWGNQFWKTRLNNVADAGERVDYADTAKRIEQLAMTENPLIPGVLTSIDISNRAGLLLANELFQLGVAIERSLERVLVQGNQTQAPAATETGWIREFAGLEQQIITGRVDMDTGIACPGADSTVISWGTGIDASVGGRTFVEMLTDLVFEKKLEGERMGFEGLQFVWVMSSKLFRALTYIWACQYWTYRCQASASNLNYTEGPEVRRLQLEMYQGRYLLVDDVAIPVVFSDGIRSTRASATVWTDDNMFLLPVSWAGGRLLNLQYKNMANEDAMSFGNFGGGNDVWTINNGMYLMKGRSNAPFLLTPHAIAFILNTSTKSAASKG